MLVLVAGHASRNVVPFERRRRAEGSPAVPLAPAPIVVPRSRKPAWPTLAALAVATGLVAVALGAWAVFSDTSSEPASRFGAARLDEALAIVADSQAERFPLRKAAGRITLVVTPDDSAALTLDGLAPAPEGSAYNAWIVLPGSATPSAAGTFDGTQRVVVLSGRVPPNARVGVTLEPEGEADRPSRPLRLVALRD